MNLETFFEKFDQFAEAPNAMAKLRELVLQLAVQGKLVEQSPDDDTATDLIKCSINERNRLVKENRIRNSQSITPVSEFNTAGTLPKSWAWTTLAEISLINPRNDVEDDALATFIPMPGIPQNYRGPLGGEIRPWGEIKKAFTHFADGDIALAKITPCFQNGKSAVFRGLKNGIGAGTTELHVARPVGGPVLPEYVWIFLKSPLFIAEGIPAMTGSAGQKRVPTGYFALKPFPLPPIAEQKRIVAKVDELMALCDRLETQQRERDARHAELARASLARFADEPTSANMNFLFHPSYTVTPADLRKTILTLAVQGKLVPQDVNDEPAEDLLRRVDLEREHLVKVKRIRRQELLGPIADEDVPFSLPESWQWRRLADVCFLITDGTHYTPKYQVKGIPFLSVKDVSGGEIDFSSTRFISEEEHRVLCKRCRPELGDILLTKVGTTGIAVTVDDSREFSIFVSLALLKFSLTNLDRNYIKHLINSPFVRQQSAENTQGIGNKNLVLRLINQFCVPIPPLAEQRRIVAKVDELMALVDQLETQLTDSRATAVNLMEAVVPELTAQE